MLFPPKEIAWIDNNSIVALHSSFIQLNMMILFPYDAVKAKGAFYPHKWLDLSRSNSQTFKIERKVEKGWDRDRVRIGLIVEQLGTQT